MQCKNKAVVFLNDTSIVYDIFCAQFIWGLYDPIWAKYDAIWALYKTIWVLYLLLVWVLYWKRYAIDGGCSI